MPTPPPHTPPPQRPPCWKSVSPSLMENLLRPPSSVNAAPSVTPTQAIFEARASTIQPRRLPLIRYRTRRLHPPRIPICVPLLPKLLQPRRHFSPMTVPARPHPIPLVPLPTNIPRRIRLPRRPRPPQRPIRAVRTRTTKNRRYRTTRRQPVTHRRHRQQYHKGWFHNS